MLDDDGEQEDDLCLEKTAGRQDIGPSSATRDRDQLAFIHATIS